ncbi:transmembrane protein 100-like [Brienomyrus brachyistius]|uniref:transmembrane protein 100-like n=1 Tax=Brienomyrus brachyistius TaxID=42636 RepID=UPI0020B287D9|nr:transmembrane protein 100-like [Brienomyrus brachyistius]
MSNCSLPERPPSTVIFDTRSEAVILPDGVVSVAGITVVTGGAELTCGSCLLAFGVWGTLIGISVVLLGIWDQNAEKHRVSTLLALGLVILALSLGMVLGVAGYRYSNKKKQVIDWGNDEGKVVMVDERNTGCVKTVTV